MIQQALCKVASGSTLTYQEAYDAMDEIMSGNASPLITAGYLAALAARNESTSEIAGSAAAMRSHALEFPCSIQPEHHLLEIVGTGGDRSNSFNISTTSAIVLAAGGCCVAKHGNRAASSLCGAADCLEALGVNIQLSPQQAARLLEEEHICFLYAPIYHAAMKYAAPIRKELGIRTIFNLLGPLANPAHASRQLMGVCSEGLTSTMADVLSDLGVQRGLVVYGHDGLDEISASAPTTVCEFEGSRRQTYVIAPEDFGYARCCKADLTGGSPAENARITLAILTGQDRGPKRNAICLNAGAAFYADGTADSIAAGVELAEHLLDSGAAMEKLQSFIRSSQV